MASICENRSFSASEELVAVALVDVAPVDVDWLCAAINALMVSGDIGDQLPVPDAGAELPAGAVEPLRSNGFVAVWPADCADDDFVVASDCRASHTDDAAPRANSMAKLRTPHDAA